MCYLLDLLRFLRDVIRHGYGLIPMSGKKLHAYTHFIAIFVVVGYTSTYK